MKAESQQDLRPEDQYPGSSSAILTLSDSFMREMTPDTPIWQATRANFDLRMSPFQRSARRGLMRF
jgi:hypothetical protein